MVVIFGSNQYNVVHYSISDTEMDLFIPKAEADKNSLVKQATNQSEVTLKDDNGTVLGTVLNFTLVKNVEELPTAAQDGNIDCFKITLAKETTLAADVITNKANIEYIAAMSDVEL